MKNQCCVRDKSYNFKNYSRGRKRKFSLASTCTLCYHFLWLQNYLFIHIDARKLSSSLITKAERCSSIACGLKSWLSVFKDPLSALIYFIGHNSNSATMSNTAKINFIFGLNEQTHKFQNFYHGEMNFFTCAIFLTLCTRSRGFFFVSGNCLLHTQTHIFSFAYWEVLSCG